MTKKDKNSLSKPLSQLKEQGKLNWEKGKGYQVKDFDTEMFQSEDEDKDNE